MSPAVPPPVLWAQQSDLLFLTVNVECKDVDYKFTENTMYFKGASVLDSKSYEVTLNFLHNINPDKVTLLNSKRSLEFKIYKAEVGPFWSTLTTDKKKPHFLKVDFNKWKDDDSDQEQGSGEPDQMDLLNKLVDLGVDKDEKPSFDDFDDEEEDSDDENIPNLTDGSGDSNKDNPTSAETTETATTEKN